jgi:hypothetical protein
MIRIASLVYDTVYGPLEGGGLMHVLEMWVHSRHIVQYRINEKNWLFS